MLDILGGATGAKDPLFWASAAIAALGVSLLAAALALQVRRMRGTRRPGGRPGRPRLRVRLPLRLGLRRRVAPGAARTVPGGYAPSSPALANSHPPVATPAAAELEPLLARLRRASDRLAAIQADSGESRLKAGPSRTEQLYRRGVG